MSTFDGYVKKFPNIRSTYAALFHQEETCKFDTVKVDYFRKLPGKPPPLVFFLSHVHSDHLRGLESVNQVRIHCSAASRELLLRLERYSHRMNFAKGVLESRQLHYKRLKNLLKPIPLNTPTEVELSLGCYIRVTLLDANHCVGAVMFLLENENNAVLYTGDIRSEPWWINSLVRNPVIIPYTLGNKRLDMIYLDTTFATRERFFKEFPSKAAGISELVVKVLKYPKETVFHFHAWTFGYEDVWIALSNALKTRIHVDEYKCRLYMALASQNSDLPHSHEGPALSGFKNGNHYQEGCLTHRTSVRLHSCEFGTGCPASSSPRTVYITPIVSRSEQGDVLPEAGAGGGDGDLVQGHGYLDLTDAQLNLQLVDLCNERISDPNVRCMVQNSIQKALGSNEEEMSLHGFAPRDPDEEISIQRLVDQIAKLANCDSKQGVEVPKKKNEALTGDDLPLRIEFPYSRHSSYEELCDFVTALQPRDIHPCTTEWQVWSPESSIASLFGHLCDRATFSHDEKMASLENQRAALRGVKRPRTPSESQQTIDSQSQDLGVSSTSASVQGESPAKMESSSDPTRDNICRAEVDKAALKSMFHHNPSAKPHSQPGIRELRSLYEQPLKLMEEQGGNKGANSDQPIYHPGSGTDRMTGLKSPKGQPISLKGELPDDIQMEPLELSNDASSNHDCQIPSNLRSDKLLEPEEPAKFTRDGQQRLDSQVTLSDAAFESQVSNVLPETKDIHIRSRKQVYRAVRGSEGAWAADYRLLSLGADYENEEVEL